MVFELFTRRGIRGRRWYWRLRARNGEVVSQSEGYTNRQDAMATIGLVKHTARNADVVQL